MTDKDPAQASDDIARQMTSAFRTEFLNEPDTLSATADEYAMSRAQGAPTKGTAFLEIKRGPNAGSRFQLDQATTSAGRHPNSDIFLDDVTVSLGDHQTVPG